jgi:excisionase family DNA binding protein
LEFSFEILVPREGGRTIINFYAGVEVADQLKGESFLTTEEVLEYLQINLRTVYRLIKAGKIPAIRVGRQWRFRKIDLNAWLASQSTSSASVTAGQPVAGSDSSR